MLVNKGDSILIKNDPIEEKEMKEQKDATQAQNPQQKKWFKFIDFSVELNNYKINISLITKVNKNRL